MRRKLNILLAVSVLGIGGSAANATPYAVFTTSEGTFTCELFRDKSPKTVENFVGLAKGTKEWQHPGTNEVMKDKPLYNGTKFHRTISGFMIQGGDPMGTGRGGPGYKFADEFSDLTFDKPGLLAMANSGPGTNGSQFFVTVGPTPHLTNKHTIFGKVVKGMDVVFKISEMPSGPNGEVIKPVILQKVEIVDSLNGAAAAPKADDAKTTASDKTPSAPKPEEKM